jgi:glutamyl-tRNA synthetase
MGAEIVTRFAPSPMGHLHIGGARTALFRWALAQGGGTYLLRIEDTDQARSSEDSTRGILEDLAWLGIDWDEGPDFGELGGDPRGVGPFHQSERRGRYDPRVELLIERDLAYPAFETAEELDAERQAAQREKRGFRYRRPAEWDRDAALSRMAREPHVVRFRMPTEPLFVHDEVLGTVEFGEEHLDDFIIRKRDGFPTFHLAVVVDDEEMGVTHVLRGQEHLNNTPRHAALQQALGFRTPTYLHLPLIFNSDGSKMSKRDKDKLARAALKAEVAQAGDDVLERFTAVAGVGLPSWLKDKRSQLPTQQLTALASALGLELPCIEVEDFRRAGYLPDVICNYLALLGWSPGEKDSEGRDLERFDRDYLASHFSAERIGRSNARFDIEKLLAFNQDSLSALDPADFFALWSDWCSRYKPEALARDEAWRLDYASMIQSRCRTLADLTATRGPGAFVWHGDDAYGFDAKAVAKFVHKGDPTGHALLAAAREVLAELVGFEPAPIEAVVRELSESRGVGMGKIAQPLRVAVTGSSASPPLGDTLAILGRAAVLARIDRCLRECAP